MNIVPVGYLWLNLNFRMLTLLVKANNISQMKGYPMSEILDRLLLEEQQLQFSAFNEDTAWQIGCWLVEPALPGRRVAMA